MIKAIGHIPIQDMRKPKVPLESFTKKYSWTAEEIEQFVQESLDKNSLVYDRLAEI